MIMKYFVLILGVIFFISSYSADLRAEEKTPAKPNAVKSVETERVIMEPQAEKILKQMSKTLGTAEEFSFEAQVEYDDLLTSGQKIQFGGTLKTLVNRPGNIYSEFDGDLAETKIWIAENKATVLDVDHNFYGELDITGSMDEAMDDMMENYDFSLPLADIIHTDTYGSLTGTTVDGIVAGQAVINGTKCTHLVFVGQEADWQLWVSEEETALPCKLLITYKNIKNAPQYQATFTDWNLSPEFSEASFKPVLPEGAEQIDFAKKETGEKTK